MSRLRAVLLPASVMAASAIALLACGQSAAPPPAAPAAPPSVGVLTVKPRSVGLTNVLPGRIAATTSAEVRPQVSGIVRSRTFNEGGQVKAGAVLYTLDAATYQAAYDGARAQLARAEANRDAAQLKAQRTKDLVEKNFVSQQAYEDAAAALKLAQADVGAARAAVDAARINLAHTRVTAPVSGRVGRSAVTPGALVTANQPAALVTIQQLDPVYVDVTQSSGEVLRLRRALDKGELQRTPANEARVGLLFEDGTRYAREGVLQFSDASVDPSTGAITLRALFPNPDGTLLPGMYVRATLEEGVRENAILVPQQAVTRDSKGDPTALVVGAGGRVELRKLQTARTIGNEWLVDSGLAAGDRVIVEGLQRARPGAVVQPDELIAAPATGASAAVPVPATGSSAAAGGAPMPRVGPTAAGDKAVPARAKGEPASRS